MEADAQPIVCIAWRANQVGRKTSGMGCSWSENFGTIRPIAFVENSLQFLSLQLVTSGFFRQLNLSKVIGKLAFVECVVKPGGKLTKSLNRGIVGQWFPNIVHLPPFVSPRGIWKKKDARNWSRFWCDVEHFAFGVTPDAMKLGLDQNTRPFPNRPTDNLLAAVGSDVLRKNGEAFVGWRSLEWPNLDIDRIRILNNAPTERKNVRLNQLRRSQAANVH
jgi:hypothetical protein